MNASARRFPWKGIVITLIGLVSCVLIYTGVKPALWPDQVDSGIEQTPAPTIGSLPTPSPSPTPTPTRSSSTPMPTSTPTASLIADPEGLPISLEVFEGKDRLLAMKIDKRGTPNGDPFKSDCGESIWYSAQGWPTPGTLSPRKSLITGHMRCKGEVYELDKLRFSGKNATLRVTFDSGDVVIAQATMPATQVPKTKLNKTKSYVFNSGDDRMIRLSTCDSTSDLQANGHVKDNIVQVFDVIQVIKK